MNMNVMVAPFVMAAMALSCLGPAATPVKAAPGADTIIVRPALDNAMLMNPGKGWVQYYGTDNYTRDFISVGYTRPCWSVVEPAEGKYNWEVLDNFIQAFKAQGKRAAFGVINFDGGMGRQYSIPEWVFGAGAVPVAVPDDSTPTHTMILPKTWDDPVYLAKMKQFIAAFGARYNGNPDVAFVDIRDYGNSGECNGGYADVKNTSLASFRDNFILPYVQAFPNTQLIIPWTAAWFEGKPPEPVYAWAVTQGVGIRRDGICSGWSKEGDECLLAYGHEPAIFEYGNTWADTVKEGFDSPETLMKYVKAGKPSYVQFHAEFCAVRPDFCRALANKMGYHFILQQAKLPASITTGVPFPIEWQWLNDGVAPLYEPGHMAIALLDPGNGVVQKQWLTESNPKGWMPDVSATETVSVTFSTVTPRAYKLAVGLFLDQQDANPAYRLGIQGRTAEGWYVISDRIRIGNRE